MQLSPYARAVERAAQLAGGVNELAAQLGLSRVLVQAYVTGCHNTPTMVFLKVVDFLMNEPRFIDRATGKSRPDDAGS